MRGSEILIAAKQVIDFPQKWGKGWDRGGRHCALTALGVAAGRYNLMLRAERNYLQKATPNGLRTVDYNDAPSTKHSDIMALYDRAIELAQADEMWAELEVAQRIDPCTGEDVLVDLGTGQDIGKAKLEPAGVR